MYCWQSWALNKLFLGLITLDFWALKLSSAEEVVSAASSINSVEHPGHNSFCCPRWSRTLLPRGCSEVASKLHFLRLQPCEHSGFSVNFFGNVWAPKQKGVQDLRGLQNTTTFTYLDLCAYLPLVACIHWRTANSFLLFSIPSCEQSGSYWQSALHLFSIVETPPFPYATIFLGFSLIKSYFFTTNL